MLVPCCVQLGVPRWSDHAGWTFYSHYVHQGIYSALDSVKGSLSLKLLSYFYFPGIGFNKNCIGEDSALNYVGF